MPQGPSLDPYQERGQQLLFLPLPLILNSSPSHPRLSAWDTALHKEGSQYGIMRKLKINDQFGKKVLLETDGGGGYTTM